MNKPISLNVSNLEKFSFTWKVESFSMFRQKAGTCLRSAYFTSHIFDGTDFCILLYPRGASKSHKNYLSCFLCRRKFDADSIQVGFSLTLESVDGLHDVRVTNESCDLANGQGNPKFVESKLIYDKKGFYLPKDVLTIKCVIWSPENKVTASKLKDNSAIEPASQISSITRIQVNKKCFIWPIAKVDDLRVSRSKTSFHIEKALEHTPSLELVFSLGGDSNAEHAQIELTQCSEASSTSKISIFVKCKMTVLSAREEYKHSQEDTFLFKLKARETWHFPNFIAMNNLEMDKYIHINDTLYLLCELSFSSEKYGLFHAEQPTYSDSVFRVPQVPRTSNLSNSIQKLYTSATFCDVSLRVGHRTFPAHKVVLCAQSPVFHSMFTSDMQEKRTNVIEVVDVDADTIGTMLEFLHSDDTEKDLELQDIFSLYSAADKYQILHLKQHCQRLLLSTMSVIDVCDVVGFADRYQDHFLMSCALHFVQTCGIEFFQSVEWGEFLLENPTLCGKVMIDIMKKM